MRILAIADTEEKWLTTHYDRKRMAGVDLIISCGDLPARYLEHIVTLANVPLVYVPGNHDAAYREHAPQGCISLEEHIVDFHGLRILGLGGSIRYNQTVYGFTEQEMRWRVVKMTLAAQAAGGIDLVVTHAPLRGYGDLDDLPHQGFESLNTLVERLHPRYLLHGHVHPEYGRLTRVREHPAGTTLINACGWQMLDIDESTLPDRSRSSFWRVEHI